MADLIGDYTDKVHIDIADGIFVPNKTVEGLEEIKFFTQGENLEIHLMISSPELIIDRWLSTDVSGLIIHVESTDDLDNLIEKVKNSGKLIGVALNPDTDLNEIDPWADKADFVHFMTVEPGFYGSKFKMGVLDKISDFRNKFPEAKVQVDGGVNPETIPPLVKAGANYLVSGGYVFKDDNPVKALEELKLLLKN